MGKNILCIIFGYALLIGLTFLCCARKQQTRGNEIYFEVVDSLLGPPVDLPGGLRVRPPREFVAIPDSLLEQLKAMLADSLGGVEKIRLIRFFFDERDGAGLMVSQIKDFKLNGDTTEFMQGYRSSLRERYGADNIKSGDFWHNDIFIKNMVTNDSAGVQFRVIGLAPDSDGLELIYTVPRHVYMGMVKSVESSIGSLDNLLKKEER